MLHTVVAELEHLVDPDTEVVIVDTEVGIADTAVAMALAGMQEDHQLFELQELSDLDCKLVEHCSTKDNFLDY